MVTERFTCPSAVPSVGETRYIEQALESFQEDLSGLLGTEQPEAGVLGLPRNIGWARAQCWLSGAPRGRGGGGNTALRKP